MNEEFDFAKELKKLPEQPGVYLMHGQKDEIIYVGKAIILKNRVRSYFDEHYKKTAKIQKMVSQITRFEYIVTDSEWEALVLECNLIKEHAPKYNTMLKDGKTYPYICVSLSEEFPRVFSTRHRDVTNRRDRYFGPYTNAAAVKDTLELLHEMYHFRTCRRVIKASGSADKERACLNYHMKLCQAPCCALISPEEYRENVNRAVTFLGGKYDEVLKNLESRMKQASDEMRFEDAIRLREQIKGVKFVAGQRQKITDETIIDRDIIGLAVQGTDCIAVVMYVRDGKMIGRDHFHLSLANDDTEEKILTSFVKQFYAGTPFIPREIYLPGELDPEEDITLLERDLGTMRGAAVSFVIPKKGKKEHVVELARENAAMILNRDREKILLEEARTVGAMRQLDEVLGMAPGTLRRVEAFDISNISGVLSVGSMVVFEQGKPKKSDYRKFRIKTVHGPDDYASMNEVLTRRLSHALSEEENNSFARLPDVILMDGGKGQVNIALSVLDRLGLSIPVCGMVKDDRHRTRGLYFNDLEGPLEGKRELFDMVTRVQDEAHRFAIEYHRSLRSKESVHSILDDIPGIGPKRRVALMHAFGDIEKIRSAGIEELRDAEGMNEAAAKAVYEFFH